MNNEKELVKMLEQLGYNLDLTEQEKAKQEVLLALQKKKLEKELNKVKNGK